MPQSIEWDHDGRRLIVPVVVYPPRPAAMNGVDGLALIDTGSTTTGLVGRFAAKLQLQRRGKRPMGGIGGDLQVERYLFRLGLQGQQAAGDPPQFPIVFDDLEGFELRDGFAFDVLLGMDILRQCDLSMSRNGSVRLAFG